jgi:hypothetical protein
LKEASFREITGLQYGYDFPRHQQRTNIAIARQLVSRHLSGLLLSNNVASLKL